MRGAVSAFIVLVISGCSLPPSGTAPATLTQGPTPTPLAVDGGCAGTQVFVGGAPDAGLGLSDNPWTWATPASSGIAAYFWHAPPRLVIAHEGDVGTKVLWVTHGAAAPELVITARPADNPTAAPVVVRVTAAASPLGNYPSSIDLPTPGCWTLQLTLGTVQASLSVLVAAAS
jgi:hypothetical protein